ncbi:50S ribosomal protein L29 [Candidatus Woesearchaeota archaeon CG_4_10_14_0_2_um_filter_57_5]|nr:MAG: 50S ribosomal protein L29 [Candidatus Woesearchaeota archaeon CG1_02_57_44]PIZ52799.1 MAG: 50S ribosomal protein L29 [Candidatus Woesearchaeota archaeon CG_4_10_14_0_2_um_filter_57_5]
MKAKELRQLQSDELDKMVRDMQAELVQLRNQVSRGTTLKSPARVRELRRGIARIITLKREQAGVKATFDPVKRTPKKVGTAKAKKKPQAIKQSKSAQKNETASSSAPVSTPSSSTGKQTAAASPATTE